MILHELYYTPQHIIHYSIDGIENAESQKADGSHAVVLIRCTPKYLEFMNSWGEGFGDNGRFKVQNAHVLDEMKFYDVFWFEKDLKESEKGAHCKLDKETPGRIDEQEIIDMVTECPVSITDKLICMLLILFSVN